LKFLRNISFSSLLVISLALAAATVAGELRGTGFAYDRFYGSSWMTVLWAVMAVTAVVYIVMRRKKPGGALIWVHLPLLLILAGAGITRFSAREGKLSLSSDVPSVSSFVLTDGSEALLPFRVTLMGCDVEYYPATTTPAGYSATLSITSRNEPVVVSVNNVADVEGFRFFLTDISDSSCTLHVSYDPWGTGVGYAGYLLLLVAGIFYLIISRGGYREFIRRPLAAVLLFVAIPAFGADTPLPRTIQRPLAANFGKMRVLYQGRVCPVSTLANDFCVAVTGSSSYRGLTAEQVLTGWIFFYDSWKNEPMIKIKGDEVRRLLAAKSALVSLSDFFRGGSFLPDSYSGIPPRDVADAAAKADFISRVCTGRLLSIYPVTSPSGAVVWLSWADEMPSWLSQDDYEAIKSGMSTFSALVSHGRNVAANDVLAGVVERQDRILASQGIDDGWRMAVERFYVKWGSPLWPMTLALFAVIIIWFVPKRRRWLFFLCFESVAAMSLLAILAARGFIGGYFPLAGGLETMLAMSLFAIVGAIVISRRHLDIAVAVAAVGALASGVALMSHGSRVVGHLMPVLNSPLLSVHVLSVMIAYTLFALMAAVGSVALASPRRAAEATRLNRTLLFPAVYMMAVGIFIGAVWANQSWGRYWGWDAKETWALITLFVYAFPLHGLSFPVLSTKRGFNLYLVLAFPIVLMTYFGVNIFLSGLHSYA